jgi:hypothetical protein
MDNSTLSKYTSSFGLSLAAASVANSLLVVAKEKSHALMAGMQKLTGHHWITHSSVVLILFAALGCLLAQANGGRGASISASRLISVLLGGVILGSFIILGFYLIAD